MLILSVFSISAYGAGWNPDIWDHSKTWIDGPYYTNAYAVKITDVFTFDCTTNYIPAYTTNGFRFQKIATNYMVYSNFYYTNTLFNSTNASFGTNGFGSTNLYSSNTITFVYFGITNTCNVSRSVEKTEGIYEIGLDIHDMRLCELGLAIYERGSTTNVKLDHDSIYANTVRIKSAVKSMVTSFCDTNIAEYSAITNWTGSYVISSIVTNGGVVSTNYHAPLLWTVSNILKSCNLPTNYFEYTPSKNADNDPHGFSIVTTCVSIIRYPSDTNYDANATRTNVIYLYDGTTTNVTGTNGQIVCVAKAYTNSIRSTYDGNDYAYWHLTNILAKLTVKSGTISDLEWTAKKGSEANQTNEDRTGLFDCKFGDVTEYGPTYSFVTTNTTHAVYRNKSASGIYYSYMHVASNIVTEEIVKKYLTKNYSYCYSYRTSEATQVVSSVVGLSSGNVVSCKYKGYYRFSVGHIIYTNQVVLLTGRGSHTEPYWGIRWPYSYAGDYCYADQHHSYPRGTDPYWEYVTNQIVYEANDGSAYELKTNSYVQSSLWTATQITATDSNAFFVYNVFPPWTESEVDSGIYVESLQNWSAVNDVIYDWEANGARYDSTKYIDTSITEIKYLLDFAVPNGFKYY